jgi:hypothetical protein
MKWLTILAVFLVALSPLALAQETQTTTDAPQRLKAQEMREQVKEVRMVKQDVRTMRADTRQAIQAERARIVALADELRACKGQNTEDCKQKRTTGKSTVKQTLANAADHVLKLLQDAKARVEASEITSKEEITSKLDAHIANIEAAKAKVEALTEESTREEYNAANKELRNAINEARKDLHVSTHSLVSRRMGAVIQMAEQLEKRLDNALAKLAEKGVDTSSVDVEAFKAKISEAKRLHTEAMDLFEKSKSAERDARADLVKQANEKLREAHAALKESHQILKEIVAQFKRINQGAMDDSTESETEETETEEIEVEETEVEETEAANETAVTA